MEGEMTWKQFVSKWEKTYTEIKRLIAAVESGTIPANDDRGYTEEYRMRKATRARKAANQRGKGGRRVRSLWKTRPSRKINTRGE